MHSTEVPRKDWIKFFDDFSKKHEGWIVTLETLHSELGDQENAQRLPLVGISADVKDGESRVVISVGGRRDAHLTRIIERPRHVSTADVLADEGDAAVEVESEDGTTTVLRFQHVPPTEVERQLRG